MGMTQIYYKEPTDPGNRQQELRIASDRKHHDNGAVFIQQVSKSAVPEKRGRPFYLFLLPPCWPTQNFSSKNCKTFIFRYNRRACFLLGILEFVTVTRTKTEVKEKHLLISADESPPPVTAHLI